MILREIKNMYIKNRLTEGVDFKRYEWLKGDNTAIIEWTANLWNNQLHTIIGKEKKTFILSERAFLVIYKSDSDYLMVIFRSESTGHIADISPFSSMSDVVDFKFYINNNVGYCKRNNVLFTGDTMTTEWNDDVKFYIYGGKMQLLEEYDSVNDKLISSLVPCQLLKSIPATLDANNRARSAGECGMYDSVSGKFYGNVANSGTFTVEGDVEPETHTGLQQIYQNKLIEGVDYETYDWLVGDGTAYIDTGHNTNEDLNWETKVVFPDTTTGTHFFWYRPIAADSSTTMIARTNNSTYVGLRIANNSNQVYWQDTSNQTVVKCDSNTILINDVSYTVTKSYGLRQKFYLFNIKLGDGTHTLSTSNGVKCAYFRFLDVNRNYIKNLVPCTLLRSIPRNLDAQCKERVAGECGMIDLISGKFYGNVANSGTFTVENDNNE